MTHPLLADFIDQAGRSLSRLVNQLGSLSGRMQTEHWVIAVAVLLVVGYISMRGFVDPRAL